LFFDVYPKPPQFLPLLIAQAIVSVIFLVVTFIYPALFVPLILWLALNTSIHYYYKGYIQQYTFAMDQLVAMTRTVSDLSKLSFPYGGQAGVSDAKKSIQPIINSWTILGERSSSDVGDLGWLLKEYIKIAFLLEPILFFRVIRKLADRKDDIRTLFEYVGFIDGCLSVLSVRQSSTTCLPIQGAKDTLIAEEMVHPLIKNCRPNSWQIADRSLLITGSNMSGKSAFIRTVAINVLCAHTLNTCFAKSFTTSFFKVYAVMNISDDLMQGKSYYMEEVLSIRQLIEQSERESECLFLLDEMFRGTNTTERIAAACSVLTFLNKNNLAIAASHDSELTTLLNDTFDMVHFCESFHEGELSFDYILKKGKLPRGNAIRILELNGYPDEIIRHAHRLTDSGH
jgi:DNA mismatch repair ATPase MutS